MTPWFYLPVVVLLVAAQTSLVPQIEIGSARPELLVCLVVCWAVVRGRGEALPWAIVGGVMLDLLSRMPPGSHLLALTMVAFLADLGHKFMHGSTGLFAASATVLASLFYGVTLLVLAGPGRGMGLSQAFVTTVVPGALYNLAIAIPMFLALRGLDRRFPVPVGPEW